MWNFMYNIGCNSIPKQWPLWFSDFWICLAIALSFPMLLEVITAAVKRWGTCFPSLKCFLKLRSTQFLLEPHISNYWAFFVGFLRRVLALESFEAMIWRSSWASQWTVPEPAWNWRGVQSAPCTVHSVFFSCCFEQRRCQMPVGLSLEEACCWFFSFGLPHTGVT